MVGGWKTICLDHLMDKPSSGVSVQQRPSSNITIAEKTSKIDAQLHLDPEVHL